MRILLLGGTGLIGEAVLRQLLSADHQVVAIARELAAHRRRWPEVEWLVCDIARLRTPADWEPLLVGIAAVVNAAGALQDGPRDNLGALQSKAMQAMFVACAAGGVGRIVQISALGATLQAGTAFLRTKAEADTALAAQPVPWVVLRPGLVLAPQAYGGSALLRAVASLPLLLPVALPEARVQTIHVADLAAAVLTALSGRISAGGYDLAEPHAHSHRDLLVALRGWLGWPAAPVLRLPDQLARQVFRAGDALAWLGWRGPLRSNAWHALAGGVTGDPTAWVAAGGAMPRSLHASLRDLPSTVQERWFARLWLLKPVAIAGLALFWLLSGLIGLASLDLARSVLTCRGMTPVLADATVLGGAALDLTLGGLALCRRTLRPAVLGMLATSIAYLVGATLWAPDLWADPLGPLVKILPACLLALVVLALLEER